MFFSKKSNSKDSSLILPSFFSVSSSDSKKRKTKKVIKIILRILKIVVYLFFFGMGLYGCFQTYADWWTATSTVPGQGLEIGFNGTELGGIFDTRFLLVYSGQGSFFPYSDFSMAYGPFYALFVWPFAQLLLYFMYATRDWVAGLNAFVGIFLILLIIRIITMAVSARSILQSEKMSEIQGKLAEINAKYKDVKDVKSRQKKQMEIQDLYRAHNAKPFAAFEQIIITLPIFLIIYRVVSTVRPLKYITLFDAWDLTQSPISQLFSNFTSTGWPYIFFILLVIPSQFGAQIVPRHLAKKRSRGATTVGQKNNQAMKRTKMINNIMTIFMCVIVVISASGIGLYWFFNSLFSMLQTYIIHKIIMYRRQKGQTVESKLSKLGIQ